MAIRNTKCLYILLVLHSDLSSRIYVDSSDPGEIMQVFLALMKY